MPMLKDYLTRLVKELQLEPAPIKEVGEVFEISFEPNITIHLKEQRPGIYFYSTLHPCPLKGREQLYMQLMEANFLGGGTKNAVIGLEEDFTFAYYLDLQLEVPYSVFREELEDFVNYVEYWRGVIQKHESEMRA
jgi:Tir chaperone protein (CesT) family